MTTGGEFTVTSGATEDPITPTNLNIRKQSSYGSAGVDALSIGNTTVFLQRAKRKIRELAYNFDTDGYIHQTLLYFQKIFQKVVLFKWITNKNLTVLFGVLEMMVV